MRLRPVALAFVAAILGSAAAAQVADEVPLPQAPEDEAAIPTPDETGPPPVPPGANATSGDVIAGPDAQSEGGETAPGESAAPPPQPVVIEGMAARMPSSAALIEGHVLPPIRHFSEATVKLQNVVIRLCKGPKQPTDELRQAFAETVAGASAVYALAFGSPANLKAPELLFTPATDTAFSTSRLDALMTAQSEAPVTLEDLRRESSALIGLPALERLLLQRRYIGDQTLENRCRLAVPVAANIHETAMALQRTWRGVGLDPHWLTETDELAERRRLRDLLQGMIDVVSVLSRDIAIAVRAGLPIVGPFSEEQYGALFLKGKLASVLRQAVLLRSFVTPGSQPSVLVEAAITTLESAIAQAEEEGLAAEETRQSIAAAVDIVSTRLPETFGFADTAFSRPLATFEIQ